MGDYPLIMLAVKYIKAVVFIKLLRALCKQMHTHTHTHSHTHSHTQTHTHTHTHKSSRDLHCDVHLLADVGKSVRIVEHLEMYPCEDRCSSKHPYKEPLSSQDLLSEHS